MQISKKRLTELCSKENFETVHSTLETEMSTSIPKSTLRKVLADNNLKCKNSRISITLVDDTEGDEDIIGSTNTYFEETEVSHPASQVNNY